MNMMWCLIAVWAGMGMDSPAHSLEAGDVLDARNIILPQRRGILPENRMARQTVAMEKVNARVLVNGRCAVTTLELKVRNDGSSPEDAELLLPGTEALTGGVQWTVRVELASGEDVPVNLFTPSHQMKRHQLEDLSRSGLFSKELATETVMADMTAVEQIVYNLADNAAKYACFDGSILKVELAREKRFLVIRVEDEGKGISASLKGKLFRPFSRSAEEAAGKQPGVGLGLALPRELARSMGGDLCLEESSHGCRFALRLPLSRT